MLEIQPSWEKYEEYTSIIFNDNNVKNYLQKNFGLSVLKINPKNRLIGKSGIEWQVDAYGYDIYNQLILIECKHYKTDSNNRKNSRVEQNIIAAFAYIVKDVGAKRGIIVTTNGLQEGANKLAEYEGIELIILHYNSTDKNFFVKFSKHNQSVATFTETMGGISVGEGICKVTHYPLEEALKRLKQRTSRTEFSEAEVFAEAERMIQESENQ